jgi:hypothetical protein
MTDSDACSCGYDGPQPHCHLCHASGIDVHTHVPEHGVDIERWPDGAPVVVDLTLGPGDFR